MFDPAKLGEDHIAPSDLVRDIPMGDFRVVETSALLVDVDRRCWLDSDARTIGDASWHPTAGSPEGLAIKCWDDGFVVGQQFIRGHKWRRSVLLAPSKHAARSFIPPNVPRTLIAREKGGSVFLIHLSDKGLSSGLPRGK